MVRMEAPLRKVPELQRRFPDSAAGENRKNGVQGTSETVSLRWHDPDQVRRVSSQFRISLRNTPNGTACNILRRAKECKFIPFDSVGFNRYILRGHFSVHHFRPGSHTRKPVPRELSPGV